MGWPLYSAAALPDNPIARRRARGLLARRARLEPHPPQRQPRRTREPARAGPAAPRGGGCGAGASERGNRIGGRRRRNLRERLHRVGQAARRLRRARTARRRRASRSNSTRTLLRSLRTCARPARASVIRTRAIGTPIDSTRSTATPAMRLGSLGRDGVGDAVGADVAEVEQDGQRIGRVVEIRHRLARLDDERRASAPRTLADALQSWRSAPQACRPRCRAVRPPRRRPPRSEPGQGPSSQSLLDVLQRSQRLANLPLLDERQWIVDFLHDDQPVGRHRLAPRHRRA